MVDNMEWFNVFGLIFIAVIMIPNVVFAIKCKDGFDNKWNNKYVEVTEQVGRLGCFGFMIINIPGTWFGWWSDEAFALYLIVDTILVMLYCAIWIICFKKNSVFRALALSIIPSMLFLFSGIMSRSVLLIIASVLKAISTSFVAIFILIITQIIAQSIASMFVIIKIPTGICNIIAGIIYAGLTYLILKMFISKIIKLPTSDFGMPKFAIKIRWILIAVLLPFVIKGSYLLIFNGKYVSSNMNGNQMFNTLSAGVAFTGIAAGFVEEMVFRGVILNALKKRWNIKVAVIVPSMLFGIVHVLGQDFSIGSCLLVIIAGTMVGVMFSMIAIESGSVWNSGIVHAIWNVVIIGGGLAIGEKMDKYSIMTYVLNSKDFAITGGEFGIESSVISLFGYIIVAGIAFFMIKSRKN